MVKIRLQQISFGLIIGSSGLFILYYLSINQDIINTSQSRDITLYRITNNRRVIFFLETSTKTALSGRAACAVESTARSHTNHTILVLHLEPKWNKYNATTMALKTISNVIFYPINLQEIFENTSLENWAKSKPWQKSKYKIEFLSDILRLVLLLKYGGIYLDSDVIVKKSLANFRNTAGSERVNIFSNGVMIFDRGNSFLKLCEERLKNVSNWNKWGITGPLLYTDVLFEKCHVRDLNLLQNISRCDEIEIPTLLSKNAFYAIPYHSWRDLFDPRKATNILALTENSYLVHMWNFVSSKQPIKFGLGQPYEYLAKQFCPKVYDIMKVYKEM